MPLDPIDLHHFAILLDVDGTILDIAPTPYEVEVPATLRATLTRVGKLAGGAIALVSGRPLQDLDRIFEPMRLPAVGGHGAEIRPAFNGGVERRHAPSLDADVKLKVEGLAAGRPGVVVEDKGYSLALHYRAGPEHAAELFKGASQLCTAYPNGTLELLTGKAVIEIKPGGFNKGTGVRELMAFPPFRGRTPIFIGDDTTDEDAFDVMPEFDGLAISVGRKVPGIDGRFQSPADVRRWLERISSVVEMS